jgi:outer membrane protein assembly factor BamB
MLVRHSRVAAVLAAITLAACASDPAAPPPASANDGRITVSNDAESLAMRLLPRSSELSIIPLADSTGAPDASVMAASVAEISFREHAEGVAPLVAGSRVQATHAVFDRGLAYVSYALIGEAAMGAVDVFNVQSPSSPRLVSSASFSNADVHTLAVSGDRLYLGTGASDMEPGETAVLEVVTLSGGMLTNKSVRIPLPSQIVTGVAVASGKVWVTTGTGGRREGGLTVLDESTLERLAFYELADARSVGVNGGTVVAVVQGSPGRVRMYDARTAAFVREVAIGGLSFPGGKASIMSRATWSFVAAGDGGTQVLQLRQNGSVSGTVVGSVPRPLIDALRDEYAVTNGVAPAGDYLVAANGGAGVWVTHSTDQTTAQTNQPTFTPMGRLGLPDGFSANFVATSYPMLFVAAGSGGLRLIEMRTANGQ